MQSSQRLTAAPPKIKCKGEFFRSLFSRALRHRIWSAFSRGEAATERTRIKIPFSSSFHRNFPGSTVFTQRDPTFTLR